VRWLPALRESVAAGVERPRIERTLAAWLHYLAEGVAEDGRALVVNDPGAAPLAARLRSAPGDAEAAVRAALDHAAVFGAEPWPDSLVARLARHLGTLRSGAGLAALLDQ
jgi:fructuronate reductase